MLLQAVNLSVYYGLAQALKDLSIEIDVEESIAILGANGAGKSTVLRTISGLVKPVSGEILFQGEPITGLSPHSIVTRGIAHVPEGRRVFPYMRVSENLKMGGYTQKNSQLYKQSLDKVYGYFPWLKGRSRQAGGSLSGGEQQMLAIARGIMSNPELLLMDEPTIGLAPIMVGALSDIIGKVHGSGMSIILVEQNASMALKLVQRGYVMETGRIVLDGSADFLANDKLVKEAYLGD